MDDPLAPSAQEAGGAGVVAVVQRRLVVWSEDGLPVVTTAPLVTQAQLKDLYAGAAAEPFDCPDPLNPDHKYHGLPMAEVAVRKQMRAAALTGDAEAVMDRLMGRPKQTTEKTTLSLTYEDALKEIERKEKAKQFGLPAGPRIVEATFERVEE